MIRWQHTDRPELKAEGASLCTMEVERSGTAVKLSITHTIEREGSKLIDAVSGGWPKVISNLKSLLETGSIALEDPYPFGSTRPRRQVAYAPLPQAMRQTAPYGKPRASIETDGGSARADIANVEEIDASSVNAVRHETRSQAKGS